MPRADRGYRVAAIVDEALDDPCELAWKVLVHQQNLQVINPVFRSREWR